MTSRDFCYWLQGFFELSGGGGELSQVQAGIIRKHLALVFKHEIDPGAGPPEHQAKLNEIHAAPGPDPVPAPVLTCLSCGAQNGHQPWCKSNGTGGGPGGVTYRC